MELPSEYNLFNDIWKINDRTLSFSRLSFPVALSSPLDFFASQPLFPKCYLASKNIKREVVAIGSIFSTEKIPTFQKLGTTWNPYLPTLYGGRDFLEKERKTALWEGFPTSQYFLPKYELLSEKGLSYLSVNLEGEHTLEDFAPHLASLNPITYNYEKSLHPPLSRIDSPNKEHWTSNVDHCLDLIKNAEAEKIVMARSTSFSFSDLLCPFSLINLIHTSAQNSWTFAFSFSEEKIFLGATPEHLYLKQASVLESEAIAGTRKRGANASEDLKLQTELLSSQKDHSEFICVKDAILEKISDLCSMIVVDESSKIIQTHTVQHLYHRITGILKRGIKDRAIINALHPTPAVAGLPLDISQNMIYDLEPFDRGWYAAPIGWISPNDSMQLVALRSALVLGNSMHLFAGAGLVPNSVPEIEWEELEQKISQFIMW